jgi:hypothetical protein
MNNPTRYPKFRLLLAREPARKVGYTSVRLALRRLPEAMGGMIDLADLPETPTLGDEMDDLQSRVEKMGSNPSDLEIEKFKNRAARVARSLLREAMDEAGY